MFQHADTIRIAHGGKSMRNKNGRRLPGGLENSIEYFGLAAHIQLCSWFIEQYQSCAELDGAKSASQSDPLPLSAGKIRPSEVTFGQWSIQAREVSSTCLSERRTNEVVRSSSGRDVVAQR